MRFFVIGVRDIFHLFLVALMLSGTNLVDDGL